MSDSYRTTIATLILASSLAIASTAFSSSCATTYCELKESLAAEVQAEILSSSQVTVVIDELSRLVQNGEQSPLVLGPDGRLVASRRPSDLERTLSAAKLSRESLEHLVSLIKVYLAHPEQ